MTIIAKRGQSLWDISVQVSGTLSNAVTIAMHNGLSVTDAIAPGTAVKIPESLVENKKVKDYYKRKQITPATL